MAFIFSPSVSWGPYMLETVLVCGLPGRWDGVVCLRWPFPPAIDHGASQHAGALFSGLSSLYP